MWHDIPQATGFDLITREYICGIASRNNIHLFINYKRNHRVHKVLNYVPYVLFTDNFIYL